eukprot:2361148-Rhodomonas_salina.2
MPNSSHDRNHDHFLPERQDHSARTPVNPPAATSTQPGRARHDLQLECTMLGGEPMELEGESSWCTSRMSSVPGSIENEQVGQVLSAAITVGGGNEDVKAVSRKKLQSRRRSLEAAMGMPSSVVQGSWGALSSLTQVVPPSVAAENVEEARAIEHPVMMQPRDMPLQAAATGLAATMADLEPPIGWTIEAVATGVSVAATALQTVTAISAAEGRLWHPNVIDGKSAAIDGRRSEDMQAQGAVAVVRHGAERLVTRSLDRTPGSGLDVRQRENAMGGGKQLELPKQDAIAGVSASDDGGERRERAVEDMTDRWEESWKMARWADEEGKRIELWLQEKRSNDSDRPLDS